jgi:hypothetical protein
MTRPAAVASSGRPGSRAAAGRPADPREVRPAVSWSAGLRLGRGADRSRPDLPCFADDRGERSSARAGEEVRHLLQPLRGLLAAALPGVEPGATRRVAEPAVAPGSEEGASAVVALHGGPSIAPSAGKARSRGVSHRLHLSQPGFHRPFSPGYRPPRGRTRPPLPPSPTRRRSSIAMCLERVVVSTNRRLDAPT